MTIARFRAAVAARMGLNFEEPWKNDLAAAFEQLGAASEGGMAERLALLEAPNVPRDLIRALARQLTVGETYFFRNLEQFRAFAEVTLERHRRERPGKTLRVLSAGCSSGEEAYSLAIIARESLAASDGEVAITAVDINPAALERAAAGIYSRWSLRETPADVRLRWFEAVGRDFVVAPSLRKSIRFEERNLAAPETDLWLPEHYDAIFCRNVIMYLTSDAARTLVGRMRGALVPGGHLFLGHAESLRELTQDFVTRNTHGTFYYERPAGKGSDPIVRSEPAPRPSDPQPGSGDWMDAVRQSTDRVRTLSEMSVSVTAASVPVTVQARLAEAMDLMGQELFNEALAILDQLPERESAMPDVLLVRAALLTHAGRLEAAECLCRELGNDSAARAGAHYLLALCREGIGDLAGAADNDRMAAYFDSRFAMPRLHLGLLARRSGDVRSARREFGEAMGLLAGEDDVRILLFGGGFTREALMGLCRSGLHAAGGPP